VVHAKIAEGSAPVELWVWRHIEFLRGEGSSAACRGRMFVCFPRVLVADVCHSPTLGCWRFRYASVACS
jgi:hypothetical protein